jgi:sec-independent protein translocase protein TatB
MAPGDPTTRSAGPYAVPVFNVTGGEVIIIILAALVVLGPEKLPDMMRRAGKLYGELRRMSDGFQQEIRSALDEPTKELRETADMAKASFTGMVDTVRAVTNPGGAVLDKLTKPFQLKDGESSTDETPADADTAADADIGAAAAGTNGDHAGTVPAAFGAPIVELPSPSPSLEPARVPAAAVLAAPALAAPLPPPMVVLAMPPAPAPALASPTPLPPPLPAPHAAPSGQNGNHP